MNDSERRTILDLQDIRKVFFRGSVDEISALNGINLKVQDQDFISVIGSNGAGKSTTFNIIAGVFPPEKGGKVIIENTDVTSYPEYKHAHYVGRVWQQPSVGTAANMTIEENMSLALLRAKKRSLKLAINKNRRKKFKEFLSLLGLGLEDRLHTIVGTLSGGQRQALSLIMATISKPSILLLDEHIATLDPMTADTVLRLTDKIIRHEKMTAMMVTHNMEIALKYGNRLIMMHKGRILVDIAGEQKQKLTIEDLVAQFEKAAGEKFHDDNVLLKDTK